MRASGAIGFLTPAIAFLGCVPGAHGYRLGFWASQRRSITHTASAAQEDLSRLQDQKLAPRDDGQDWSIPPYGYEPPPLTQSTSTPELQTSTSSGMTAAFQGIFTCLTD